ncbi:MAG: matrixin family metalloprotease [Gammaproteobacteria bacterium]|nr:matrixin family metalloprotease [Gammaproteobacteria bacterium]
MTMKTTHSWQVDVTLISALALMLTACATPPPSTGDAKMGDSGTMRPASGEVIATTEAVEQAWVELGRTERTIANDWQNKTFEVFEATVYREPGGGKYIVNGDTPIVDRKHLQEFFENNVQKSAPIERGLTVITVGGVDAVWSGTEKRNLTYCVSTAFGTIRHNEVVDAMTAAGNAWEAVADVDLIHASAQDNDCTATNNQVVFDVRPVNGAPYIARAFFPNDSRSDRNVLINSSAFTLGSGNLTLTGVLRHELGHTLGFRHEHTRPEAATCFEDANWRPLTSYDAFSTMHYPQCNGAGDWSLELTAADQSGAACLYGAAPGFTIDTTICMPPPPTPQPCGCSETVTISGQVASGAENNIGPFSVAVGSQFTVQMAGTGDPDLYLRFRVPPSQGTYDCRPYLSGAAETCDLPVPTGATEAFIMVRGFTAGSYNLTIEHTPNP